MPTAGRPVGKEEDMSRGTVRPVFIGLLLVLAFALAAPPPSEAAGLRDRDPGPSLTVFVPQWLMNLWERISAGIGTTGTPPGGGSGDIGMQVDPNG